MPRGGARPRSGPPSDPNSRTSERARRAAKKKTPTSATDKDAASDAVTTAAFSPTSLPAKGRSGNPPAFPLPKIARHVIELVDGKPAKVPSAKAGTEFRKRELEIWRSVWKTPQAVAWERDAWRWPTIAEFCRLKTIIESEPEANAALVARLREYRNEIGLSPDGLKMNGWAIAPDQLAEKRAEREKKPAAKSAKSAGPVRRLR